METKQIGRFGNMQVYVESDGKIAFYNGNGSVSLSVEAASTLASLLIKAVSHSQNEVMKAMNSVPEAIKDFKKTAQEVKQVTDRFAELANGE